MSRRTSESLDDRIIEKKTSKQKKSFDDYIRELPLFIGKEIFKFILPNSEFIEFKKRIEFKKKTELKSIEFKRRFESIKKTKYPFKSILPTDEDYPSAYSKKYETAFLNGEQLVNRKREKFLSRIPKKNGKHRYYITTVRQIHGRCGLGMDDCQCKFEKCYCESLRKDDCPDYPSRYCHNGNRCNNCIYSDVILCSSCESLMDFKNVFYSIYVGKDIDCALIELLF
jgi:hypothetical protein